MERKAKYSESELRAELERVGAKKLFVRLRIQRGIGLRTLQRYADLLGGDFHRVFRESVTENQLRVGHW